MHPNALMVFARHPEAGAVKTRLASVLGDDLTLSLYHAFLADMARMAGQVDAQTLLVHSGPEGTPFPGFAEVPHLLQRGADIGERMFNALQDAFARGFERAVLIGSDLPDLPAKHIRSAFGHLAEADVVLGPSLDGGYYLVGSRRGRLCRSIFTEIAWSTPAVLAQTRERIAAAGLTCATVAPWADIDDYDGLRRFHRRRRHDAAPSHVMALLHREGLFS